MSFSRLFSLFSNNISGQAEQQEKSEFHEHEELIALIGMYSLRVTIETRILSMLPSGHTKRMRSLALSPSTRDLFATSSLILRTYQVLGSSFDSMFMTSSITVISRQTLLWLIFVNTPSKITCESKFLKDKPYSKGLSNRNHVYALG
ncbi:unnamed protein product [Eruca vesicaria subsp. sativa]|uniref:Uncharacterized protein n=1 Tax=Eruca vesicaria subsp. sativa TaxID=29727 RepID=A0ABC8KJS0_ERUVS|nr:unnamed protein product [Eruca vesicaria subsp. sativa]